MSCLHNIKHIMKRSTTEEYAWIMHHSFSHTTLVSFVKQGKCHSINTDINTKEAEFYHQQISYQEIHLADCCIGGPSPWWSRDESLCEQQGWISKMHNSQMKLWYSETVTPSLTIWHNFELGYGKMIFLIPVTLKDTYRMSTNCQSLPDQHYSQNNIQFNTAFPICKNT